MFRLVDGRFQQTSDTAMKSFFHHNNKEYIYTNVNCFIEQDQDRKEERILLEDRFFYDHALIGDYFYFGNLNNKTFRVEISGLQNSRAVIESGAFRTDGSYLYYIDEESRL